jgi:hypothetical protein
MDQRTAPAGRRALVVLLAALVVLAAAAGVGTQAARADDPTAVELVGTWFGELATPAGAVPVELQVPSADNRRFEWVALEDFGAGFVTVATGDGTLSESGNGQINGDGIPGNPAGLRKIFAHGDVAGPVGAMSAAFDFRGINIDGTMITGMITLSQRPTTG